jgi:hypothetical protein
LVLALGATAADGALVAGATEGAAADGAVDAVPLLHAASAMLATANIPASLFRRILPIGSVRIWSSSNIERSSPAIPGVCREDEQVSSRIAMLRNPSAHLPLTCWHLTSPAPTCTGFVAV